MILKVRGTEDILDLKLQNFIIDKIKKYLALYNFKEIETPILEHTNLFVRTLGQETDVVSKEMYTFKTESGDSICLRPEATASTMRAFLENGIQTTPWKVFSIGPMFRHERPQLGRWRQFTQINIETIGSNSITQDAYFIKMLDSFFARELNLNNYVLKLNFLGVLKDRTQYKEKLLKYLNSITNLICDTCNERKIKNILRVFDCKNDQCQKTYLKAPKLINNLGDESKKEWDQLLELLDILSVNYIYDPSLVRGLDYYNKTVFEFSSKELGAQNSFCGGGRYDSLATQIGAKEDYPSIGAAIGFGRLTLLVEKISSKLPIPQEPSLAVIIPMNDEQKALALLLANELQSNNKCIEILLEGGSMKSMMRKANNLGAKYVLILGEEEQQNNTVSIKNMQTGESFLAKQTEVNNLLS